MGALCVDHHHPSSNRRTPVAGSLTAQQSSLLAQQKQMNLQLETFQTFQELESTTSKGEQTYHDALLAVIEGMKGS
jgi:hypothetical protein